MFYKAHPTAKGLALDAKIRAGFTTYKFTRIDIGDGTYDDAENLDNVSALKSVKQTFELSSCKIIDANTVRLRAVINNTDITTGYYMREMAVFAIDPDEGEILYSISLGVPGKLDYQPSVSEMEAATSTIDILTGVSDAKMVKIVAGTGAAASALDLQELDNKKLDRQGGDISNTVVSEFTANTTDFPVPNAGEKTKTILGKIKKFFEDVKAWMTGVCLIGQIVNNCTSSDTEKPLSAAQGKVLMDLYNVLNTKLTVGVIDSNTTILDFVVNNRSLKQGFVIDEMCIRDR